MIDREPPLFDSTVVFGSVTAPPPPPLIESHLAIGDGRSVALVDGCGGIDWLCWPRFDSAPLFAALLDRERGGVFRIAPHGSSSSSFGDGASNATYVKDTNVAMTRFDLKDGRVVTLTDGMTIDEDGTHESSLLPEHEIVRLISCVGGAVMVDLKIELRSPFLERRPKAKIETPDGTLRITDRGRLVVLRVSQPVSWREDGDGQCFRCALLLEPGKDVGVSLAFAADAPFVASPLKNGGGRQLIQTTCATWRRWAARAKYDGPYRDAVIRSALALKLLCYTPSGAIIAAPTTSLPETLGADRNWDYRFCWLRDAAFTARALFELGYEEEADAFVGWLLHATNLTRPKLKVLYDVFGEEPPSEREIDGVAGYGGARPIRVGNRATEQVQLDVYGEVIDAVSQAWLRGRRPDRDEVKMVADLGKFVCAHWRDPDHGIWEPREDPTHHVHSRVLCWVALDRLLRLSEKKIFNASLLTRDRFAKHRSLIADEVRSRGYSTALGSYVATLDGEELDAALLLLSWYGFEDPASERMKSTFRTIRDRLGLGEDRHLLLRNREIEDDGGFVACAFWAAEHLARGGGTLDEARSYFEALLRLQSPSGLYGEIVHHASGAHLGNYPQGFSHLALLNAALSLEARVREEANPS